MSWKIVLATLAAIILANGAAALIWLGRDLLGMSERAAILLVNASIVLSAPAFGFLVFFPVGATLVQHLFRGSSLMEGIGMIDTFAIKPQPTKES